jgi:uncharacterized protein with HEPN domain
MLDHAREAVAMAESRSRSDLDGNRMLQLALVRLIEIVGKAAARVSESVKDQLPSIPWREIVGMRNRVVHGYDAVDLNVLWDTITVDLPLLIDQLEEVERQGMI